MLPVLACWLTFLNKAGVKLARRLTVKVKSAVTGRRLVEAARSHSIRRRDGGWNGFDPWLAVNTDPEGTARRVSDVMRFSPGLPRDCGFDTYEATREV